MGSLGSLFCLVSVLLRTLTSIQRVFFSSFLVDRFPTFVGEAIDKDAPKDADVPDKRRAGTAAAAAKGDE